MANFPNSVYSPASKSAGQTIVAGFFNDPDAEITAIANGLENGYTVAAGAAVAAGATFKAGDGTVAAPGLTFVNEPDCGLYKEGTNAIAVGTAGVKALGIDATQFIDSPTQPRARAYKTGGAQSIADSTATAITFDAETFDVGAMHAGSEAKITVPTGGDGLYLIIGSVSFAGNATGVRALTIRKGGATALADVQASAVGASTTIIPIMCLVVLAAAEYVELMATQTSTGALNVNTGETTTFLSVVKLW